MSCCGDITTRTFLFNRSLISEARDHQNPLNGQSASIYSLSSTHHLVKFRRGGGLFHLVRPSCWQPAPCSLAFRISNNDQFFRVFQSPHRFTSQKYVSICIDNSDRSPESLYLPKLREAVDSFYSYYWSTSIQLSSRRY